MGTMQDEARQARAWLTSTISKIDKEVLRRFRLVLENLISENLLNSKDDADLAAFRLLSVIKEEINVDLYEKGVLSHLEKKSL